MREVRAVCWRRLDLPGHDGARLMQTAAGWRLAGTAVLAPRGVPAVLTYTLDCDDRWRTRAGTIRGFIGDREVVRDVFVDERGRWFANGVECPTVHGATDLTLEFSPATAILPMRRLALGVGEEGAADSAWLRFPVLTIEPLQHRYHRIADGCYRYARAPDEAACTLTVDDTGFVTRFGDVWQAETG